MFLSHCSDVKSGSLSEIAVKVFLDDPKQTKHPKVLFVYLEVLLRLVD